MRAFIFLAGVALAAWPAAVEAESPKTVEFRYAPKVGEVTRHRVVTNSVGTLGFGPGVPGARFTQSTTQETAGECRQVNPDGSAVFDMTLTRIATRMNLAGISVNYDSRTFNPKTTDNAVIRMIGRFFSALVGPKLTMTFDPQGGFVRVAGMPEAVSKAIRPLKEDLAKEPAGILVSGIIDDLAAQFDDSTFNEQMKSFYRFLPTSKRPVLVGEKWDQDWTMNLEAVRSTCAAQGHYELLGVETLRGHPCAKIGIKETFTLRSVQPKDGEATSPAAKRMNRLLGPMDVSLDASGSDGVAYWDYRTGVLVQLRQTQRIVTTVKFKKKGKAATTSANADTRPADQGMSGTITQNSTSSIQVDLLEGPADQTTTGSATSVPAVR